MLTCSELRSIEFLGAAGRITGSRYLVENNNGHVIGIDYGMFQGPQEDELNQNSKDNSIQPEAILFSHGHLDHIGLLHRSLSTLYMTPPSRDITAIQLRDAERVSPHLYSKGSVNSALKRIECVDYDKSFSVNGSTATFRKAGHILGSASIEIHEKGGETILFSGDLGRKDSRTVQPATPSSLANIVVMETTYGDRIHDKEDDPVEAITDAVRRIRKTKGTLLIPAFSIDRTQILLSIFGDLKNKGVLGNNVPVFLDSPMGIDVTKVYIRHRELLNDRLREQKNLFSFSGLIKTYRPEESNKIADRRGAKIIIASSGMMKGGRIGKHAANYLADKDSVILFVGHPAEGTPSRAIVDGAKEVFIDNQLVFIGGTVLQTSGLSAHPDKRGLLEWLRPIKIGGYLRKLFLTHGSDPARQEFAYLAKNELGIRDIILPKQGEIYDLYSNK